MLADRSSEVRVGAHNFACDGLEISLSSVAQRATFDVSRTGYKEKFLAHDRGNQSKTNIQNFGVIALFHKNILD